eukprot:12696157-Prorocentrum_lima.AAC.1
MSGEFFHFTHPPHSFRRPLRGLAASAEADRAGGMDGAPPSDGGSDGSNVNALGSDAASHSSGVPEE